MPLPDLEATIFEIAVELLLVERENRYPSLLYGHAEDRTSVRLSAHYVMGLLAYGFTQKASNYFDVQPGWRQRPLVSASGLRETVSLC